jgi:YHS domain-containing protein
MVFQHTYRAAAIVAGLLTGLLGGCAASAPPASSGVAALSTKSAQSPTHAECLVCKKNADLACVDVDVDAKTPYADFAGKRYFFCSDECKAEFQKNPAKFTNAK